MRVLGVSVEKGDLLLAVVEGRYRVVRRACDASRNHPVTCGQVSAPKTSGQALHHGRGYGSQADVHGRGRPPVSITLDMTNEMAVALPT